jgi:hypothetical protein
MRETSDFFQEQAKQCQALAPSTVEKSDREFWLRLARRWENLLRANKTTSSKLFKKLGSSVQYLQRNDLQNDLQIGGRPDAALASFAQHLKI